MLTTLYCLAHTTDDDRSINVVETSNIVLYIPIKKLQFFSSVSATSLHVAADIYYSQPINQAAIFCQIVKRGDNHKIFGIYSYNVNDVDGTA